jgi:hypothetical protein
MAYVRVVNAMPDGQAVDIFAGDDKIFAGVKSGESVPYRELAKGVTTFRVRWTGHDKEAPLAENIEVLGYKEHSTILVRPDDDGKLDVTVFDDHEWAPDTGKAKVRVVHAIAGMSDIDVYSEGKRLLGGVDFHDESRYVQMEPITGDLELKRDDNHQTVATVPAFQVEASKAYTVLLIGYKDKLSTIVLEDQVETPAIPSQYPLGS